MSNSSWKCRYSKLCKLQAGFTIAELLLVLLVIVLLAGIGGNYFVNTYKAKELSSVSDRLALMAKYARLMAIEKQQEYNLYLDSLNNDFYLVTKYSDENYTQRQDMVVSNSYCRKQHLASGLEFEAIEITPDETLLENRFGDYITFYSDGTCDSAMIQIGNGRHNKTAVFDQISARVFIHDCSIQDLPPEQKTIDLDLQ